MNPKIAEYINTISNKGELTEIDLFDLGLTNEELSPLIEALKENPDVAAKITSLLLGSNKLETTPDLTMLTGLIALKIIDLSKNELDTAPDLAGLVSLEELDLHGNKISNWPILIGLTKLKKLNLSENRIDTTADLTGLTSLEILILYDNLLINSPKLTGLVALRVISLGSNRLGTPPDLTGLVALEELDLGDNKLMTSPNLTGINELVELKINGNNLTIVSKGILLLEKAMHGNNFTLEYDAQEDERIKINQDTLDKHFTTILANTANDAIEYMHSIGALGLHNKLLPELVTGPLMDMLPPPGLALTLSSMNYFKDIATKIATKIATIPATQPNHRKLLNLLNVLNKYTENNLEKHIHKVRSYYSSVYNTVGGIENKRNKLITAHIDRMLYFYINTALEQRPLKDTTRTDPARNPYALVQYSPPKKSKLG